MKGKKEIKMRIKKKVDILKSKKRKGKMGKK